MEHARFDILTRGLDPGATRTRRGAITLLVAAIVGNSVVRDTAAKQNRKRRRRKRLAESTCFGTATCAYQGTSYNYDDCYFAGSSVFANGIGHGSAFRRANFNSANLEGADLSGSRLSHADLRNANLRNANLDGSVLDESCLFDADLTGVFFRGPILQTAYLCRTIVPEGFPVDRDCKTAPPCCYT
jgi:hypothetical protein